jgi:Glycosyltransferase family 28 N-terminal domain
MRLTLLTIGSRGDVQPMVALGQGLRRAGHEVQIATFGSFRPLVEEALLPLAPLAGAGQALTDSEEGRAMLKSGGNIFKHVRAIRAISRKLLETDCAVNCQLPAIFPGVDEVTGATEILLLPGWGLLFLFPCAGGVGGTPTARKGTASTRPAARQPTAKATGFRSPRKERTEGDSCGAPLPKPSYTSPDTSRVQCSLAPL